MWSIGGDKLPKVKLVIGNYQVPFIVDTGATVNLIGKNSFDLLVSKPKLNKSTRKIYAYGSSIPLELLGEFRTRVMFNGQYRNVSFCVSESPHGNLIGYDSSN